MDARRNWWRKILRQWISESNSSFYFLFLEIPCPPPPSFNVGDRLSERGGGVTMEYITPVDLQIVNPNNEKGGWGGEAAQPVEKKMEPTA